MVPLGLADRLSVAPAHGASDTLHVEGDGAQREAAPDDLVLRGIAAARRAVAAMLGPSARDTTTALAARLEKRIPVAAGLGGGSSDAAAAIEAALAAWGVELPMTARVAAAASVGSDVPFFLVGAPALVEGRGERLTPLREPVGNPVAVLIVTPALEVSTTAVFGAFDHDDDARPADPRSARLTSEHLAQELRAGLASEQLVARAGVLTTANDLVNATATIVPELRSLRRALARRIGRAVGQSGSGPTLWALYSSLTAAQAAARDIEIGLREGSIQAPGGPSPRIHATTIFAGAPAADQDTRRDR
jgi:4-diphosphocytidyl-2-C-methyl-D-erythritol kinase